MAIDDLEQDRSDKRGNLVAEGLEKFEVGLFRCNVMLWVVGWYRVRLHARGSLISGLSPKRTFNPYDINGSCSHFCQTDSPSQGMLCRKQLRVI